MGMEMSEAQELPPAIGALRFERRNGGKNRTADRRAVVGVQVSPGALLLPPELRPCFEAVLSGPALLERCSYTFALPKSDDDDRNQPLLRCSRCKVARYSSAEAQRRDWRGGSGAVGTVGLHSRECAALRAFAETSSSGSSHKVPPASIRLAARILWKQAALLQGKEEKGGKEKGEKSPSALSWWSSPGAVSTLRHHFRALPDGRKVETAAAAAAARSYMRGALTDEEKRRAAAAAAEEEEEEEEGEENKEGSSSSSPPSSAPPPPPSPLSLLLPTSRRLAEILSTLACNAHALSDASQGTLSSYGVGLFPAAAMLNQTPSPHSL